MTPSERPYRRLPLRELLTDAEKRTRDLINQFANDWVVRASEVRDLSRPLRRKSNYPSFAAMLHAIEQFIELDKVTDAMEGPLYQELEEIREHARRERLNRP